MPAGPRWRPAYVGIGSNLDAPVEQIGSAIDSIAALPECVLTQRSSLYRSAPLGGLEQPDFVNAVVALLTTLGALALLERLQSIETAHGRRRDVGHWGPRTIDLDLLVVGDEVVDEPRLSLPHPGIAGRNFVLLPLRELAPHMLIPGLGTVSAVARQNDNSVPTIHKL